MLGFLKKLLGGRAEPPVETPAPRPPVPPAPALKPVIVSEKAPAPAPAKAASGPPPGSGEWIELPLELVQLPPPVAAQLARPVTAGDQLRAPLPLILPQLQGGLVRMTAKDIATHSPRDLFKLSPETESSQVALPLAEILRRVRREHWRQRKGQSQVEVPDDVPSPFTGKQGEGKNIFPSAPLAAAPAAPLPAELRIAPGPALSALASSAPKPEPMPTLKPTVPLPVMPSAAVSEPAKPEPAPVAPLAPAAPEIRDGAVVIPVSLLLADWPEAIRAKAGNLAQAALRIPLAEAESGLKRGKLQFSWSQLAGWISPRPAAEEPLASVAVEVPLRCIAPVFMAARKGAASAQKASVPENIPDLFKMRAPVAPTTDAAPAAPALASIQPATAEASPVAPAPVAALTLAQIFGKPEKKSWSPAELVSEVARLAGATGAVMATSDGLLVAGQTPAGISPETLAAFLPQMCSRLTQYGKDLSLGEPSTFTLGIGAFSLRLIRSGAVYFAVLGREGESLNPAHLAALEKHLAGLNR